ncbi:nickel/cobalt transporter [Rhodobacter sp. 24-YEA-8]|uniref:nickel/cobalt transporter n=1 Tax=Rhodobacter sp. 24-YEA-8 TaxID=1884310 RepID=UPI00089C974F|nr:high frequency lysogenization protein HflD [Rhodobacter sp. 24-YEA-8]SEC72814.1 ABC-type nickel/cobalt efflux system, permease component RcnA [Rhodobacter sp. 24-YEA-8]
MNARRLFTAVLLLLVVLIAMAVYVTGLDDALARRLIGLQRDFQNALGQSLRALRTGDSGAVSGFLGLCFAYGFFHALGPGHGKALIAGYGFASRATLRRLVWIAGLAALGQALVAIVLVYGGIWMFEARDRVEGLAALIEPLAMLAIAGLGAMLLRRGLRRLQPAQVHRHHPHDETCGCGHAHAPGPDQVAAASGWREVLALVAGIALRPCTGALFLLILTWRLGIDGLGILGTIVMAAGTFLITALAATLAGVSRQGLALAMPGASPRLFAAAEIVTGVIVIILCLSTALRLL